MSKKPIELYVLGAQLQKIGDLLSLLSAACKGFVIVIDEIHQVNPAINGHLEQVITHGVIDVEIGPPELRKVMRMKLPDVTFVGKSSAPDRISPAIAKALAKQSSRQDVKTEGNKNENNER